MFTNYPNLLCNAKEISKQTFEEDNVNSVHFLWTANKSSILGVIFPFFLTNYALTSNLWNVFVHLPGHDAPIAIIIVKKKKASPPSAHAK